MIYLLTNLGVFLLGRLSTSLRTPQALSEAANKAGSDGRPEKNALND